MKKYKMYIKMKKVNKRRVALYSYLIYKEIKQVIYMYELDMLLTLDEEYLRSMEGKTDEEILKNWPKRKKPSWED